MKSKIVPVPEILKNDVACIRIAEHSGEERLAINVFLNGLPGIVFQHNNGQSPVEKIVTRSRIRACVPTLYAYGQMTQPGIMNYKREPFETIQVVLKPHALQTLLGINASALTNGVAELDEFAAGDLNDQLLEAQNEQERITLLTDYLVTRLNRENVRDHLVGESLRLIHKNPGSMTVRTLLETLNISERQFERRFCQTVGLSPQFYMRVKRFNAAIRLMKTGRFAKLTDVAHALNFYDQSHFIRDIKAFSGVTPKQLRVDDLHPDQSIYAYA